MPSPEYHPNTDNSIYTEIVAFDETTSNDKFTLERNKIRRKIILLVREHLINHRKVKILQEK